MNNTIKYNVISNLEALRDISQVWRNFEGRNFEMFTNDHEEIVVTCYEYPFTMKARFQGDGVAILSASIGDKKYGEGIYDSHRTGDNEKLFLMEAKDLYERAASKFIKSSAPFSTPEIKDWAIRYQSYVVKEEAENLLDASKECKKAVGHLVDYLKRELEVLDKLL